MIKITCVRYYNHIYIYIYIYIYICLWQKLIIFLGIFSVFILLLNSKIMGTSLTMDFYGLNMHLCIECTQMHNINTSIHIRKKPCSLWISLSITFHAWNKKFKTTSNRWELSIFIIVPPYTSKKYISIFERFKRRYIMSRNFKFFEPW